MKDALVILIALVALGLSTFTLMQNSKPNAEEQRIEEMIKGNKSTEEHHEHEDIEVAYVMAHLQRHFNKLYFAGTNDNWDLAGFYVHEMEEAMEEIIDGKIVDDGVDLSQLMSVMGLMPLETLEDAVKKQDKTAFLGAYDAQVLQCNSCHVNSKHPYIKLKAPQTPFMDNQIFTVE